MSSWQEYAWGQSLLGKIRSSSPMILSTKFAMRRRSPSARPAAGVAPWVDRHSAYSADNSEIHGRDTVAQPHMPCSLYAPTPGAALLIWCCPQAQERRNAASDGVENLRLAQEALTKAKLRLPALDAAHAQSEKIRMKHEILRARVDARVRALSGAEFAPAMGQCTFSRHALWLLRLTCWPQSHPVLLVALTCRSNDGRN